MELSELARTLLGGIKEIEAEKEDWVPDVTWFLTELRDVANLECYWGRAAWLCSTSVLDGAENYKLGAVLGLWEPGNELVGPGWEWARNTEL
jgi:hypothetical protein